MHEDTSSSQDTQDLFSGWGLSGVFVGSLGFSLKLMTYQTRSVVTRHPLPLFSVDFVSPGMEPCAQLSSATAGAPEAEEAVNGRWPLGAGDGCAAAGADQPGGEHSRPRLEQEVQVSLAGSET